MTLFEFMEKLYGLWN